MGARLVASVFAYTSLAVLIVSIVFVCLGHTNQGVQAAAIAAACFALWVQTSARWNSFAFSIWVAAFVLQAFAMPHLFLDWPTGPAPQYVSPLIQIIMFGMGTTLTASDFGRVFLVPKSIAIGMVLQFTLMPSIGWALTKLLQFPPEIAVGVVLIGACPGGVASNVITYLARGDVALSVTLTACSTLAAPLMTPLAMSLLAGSEIDLSFSKMVIAIVEITLAPIFAGLGVSYFLQWMKWRGPWLDRVLSAVAMFAICVVIGIVVAQSRDALLKVGALLVFAAMIHNLLGYGLGYSLAKACRLDETTSRTIAIEVGMQNGGMATALAINVLQSPPAALAGAIFAPWMSISGSVLASWWRADVRDASKSSAAAD